MKMKLKLTLIGLAVLGCGAVVWCLGTAPEQAQKPEEKVEISRKGHSGKKIRGKKISRTRRVRVPGASQQEVKPRVKPTFGLDDEAEELLSTAQRELIKAIREALDANDFKTLRKLVQKLQASPEWPDGIPVAIRKAAIEALKWCNSGLGGLAEIAGFLADGNEEVVADAIEAYEDAMFEANGDRELSLIVTTACQAVNDPDAIESFLMELNNMRNSVAIETIKNIMATGSEAAKNALAEAIEFLTGEDWIKTPEDLDKWYNDSSGDNLDDEDAEEFYGPQKDD